MCVRATWSSSGSEWINVLYAWAQCIPISSPVLGKLVCAVSVRCLTNFFYGGLQTGFRKDIIKDGDTSVKNVLVNLSLCTVETPKGKYQEEETTTGEILEKDALF